MSDEKSNFKIIRDFGPSVFKIKIPESIVTKLNDYIDKIIINEKKRKDLDFGNQLVGDVTEEFILENEIVKSSGWLNFLSICVQKWIEIETGKKITKFNVERTWIVRQFKNEYNPTHWHSGHISGAGFLKVPDTLGANKQKSKDKTYYGGNLQLIHGSKMFLCESTIDIKPAVGDFYFFPNYLMHTVFPFKDTDEERRSISFNGVIDEEIYNVYGK